MEEQPEGVVVAVSRNESYSFSKPQRDELVLVAGLGVAGDSHAGVHVRHQGRVRADPSQPNLRQVHLIHAELFEELREQGYGVEPGQLGENVTTRGVDLLGLPRGTVLRFGPPSDGAQATLPAGQAGPAAASGVGAGEAAASSATAGLTAREAVAEVLGAAGGATLNEATANAVVALEAAAGRTAPGGTAVAVTGLRNPCQQINTFRSGLLKEVIGRDPDGNVVRKGGVMAVVLYGGPVRPGDVVRVQLPPEPHEPLECV
jgi:MOSC domain-containing protein YiiM